MRYLHTLFSVVALSAGTLWGTIEEWQALVPSASPYPFVAPIGLTTYIEGSTIGVEASPTAVAITPDGHYALVTNMDGQNLSVLDLTVSPVTSYVVPLGTIGAPTNVAITPDGTMALVVCGTSTYTVAVLDLTAAPFAVVSTVASPVGDALAITSDGSWALVGFRDRFRGEPTGFQPKSGGGVAPALQTVAVLDLTTDPVSLLYTALPVVCSGGISITPDGTRALVVTQTSNSVAMMDLTATPIPQQLCDVTVGTTPIDVAITPDGNRALVIYTGDGGGVTVLDIASSSLFVETLSIPLGAIPTAIAITPDGNRAAVTVQSEENSTNNVIFLDLTTSPVSILTTSPFDIENPADVAITPDQAPTAQFTATLKNKGDTWQRVAFDASASTSPVGDIAQYEWKFGDGKSDVTNIPWIWHTYHFPNKGRQYRVRLTVTNTAGTSQSVVLTGRTVSNNGGPSATSAQPIVVWP